MSITKTYKLNQAHAEELLNCICRYKTVMTEINETEDELLVYTAFADNAEPTSLAYKYKLQVIDCSKPKMPRDEKRRRVEGKFPDIPDQV